MMKTTILALAIFVSGSPVFGCPQTNSGTENSVKYQGSELRLLFSDDFEKGRDQWKTTDEDNWNIKTRAGAGHAFGLLKRKSKYQPPVRSPHNIALVKDKQFEDFVLTFEVRNPEDTGAHRDCCVFFGYQDSSHFYYVHLGHKPDPASGQIMIVNNKPRTPLTKNEKTIPWTSNWHKVKVARSTKSGAIEIYFDDMDKPVLSVKDKTFGKGQIGLGSFDDINDFDNVRIYGN